MNPTRTIGPEVERMDAKEFLRENVAWIKAIARRTPSRGCAVEELEDFQSYVLLRLVEKDYAILHSFRGDSSIKTYLSRVIRRMWLDFLTAKHGKWRPSAASKRLGCVAVELERLLFRDGLPLREALTLVRHRFDLTDASGKLTSLAGKLPVRPRRSFVPAERAEVLPAWGGSPEEAIRRRERASRRSRLQRVLLEVFQGLDQIDRWLLRKRFKEEWTVREIAERLGIEPKKLYRRYDQMMRRLRERLTESGVTLQEVEDLFGCATGEFMIPLSSRTSAGTGS